MSGISEAYFRAPGHDVPIWSPIMQGSCSDSFSRVMFESVCVASAVAAFFVEMLKWKGQRLLQRPENSNSSPSSLMKLEFQNAEPNPEPAPGTHKWNLSLVKFLVENMAQEKGLWSQNNDYLWFPNIYLQNDLQGHVIAVKLQCKFPIKLYMIIKAKEGVKAAHCRSVSQAYRKRLDSGSS